MDINCHYNDVEIPKMAITKMLDRDSIEKPNDMWSNQIVNNLVAGFDGIGLQMYT
jgi:hypothetical protein